GGATEAVNLRQPLKTLHETRRTGAKEVMRTTSGHVAANHPAYLLASWPPGLLVSCDRAAAVRIKAAVRAPDAPRSSLRARAGSSRRCRSPRRDPPRPRARSPRA